MPLSRTFYTHARTTVLIATQTTPWCVAASDCNQRGSIALKKTGEPRIVISKMSHPNLMSQFAQAFEKGFDAPQPKVSITENWEILRDTIHRTILATFGKKTSKTHDWFDAKSSEMRPVIDANRTALMEYKQSHSERNMQIIRAARSKVQQAARRYENEYWTQLSQYIQTSGKCTMALRRHWARRPPQTL